MIFYLLLLVIIILQIKLMNRIPPDNHHDKDPVKISHSDATTSIPTVTQEFSHEEDQDDDVMDPEPEKFSTTSTASANRTKTVTFSKNNSILLIPKKKQSKKAKSCIKVSHSVTKPSPWISRLPKRLDLIKKEKDAAKQSSTRKKKNKKEKNSVVNLRVGALVKKRLSFLLKERIPGFSRLQFATVFGTLKEKNKGGKWVVLFENKRQFTLKPSEFDFVASDSSQQVISVNTQDEMVLKTSKDDEIDSTSRARLRPSASHRKNNSDAFYM